MKCDELKEIMLVNQVSGERTPSSTYKKAEVDEAIAELKARIHELENMPHTDNSAVIELLETENEALKKELSKLSEATRWRNFKDEPPEHHQWIEACYREDRIRERLPRIEIRRWDDGMKYDVFDQELYIGWSPLPKAPEVK